MKVILLRDVAKLGRRFSVVEVPDGFAFNKLIPQKMAEPATPANLKKVGSMKDRLAHDAAVSMDSFKDACALLAEKPVVVKAEANAQDHLFKAVKVSDIVSSLAADGITSIPAEAIIIAEPIKALGEYKLSLNYLGESGELNLQVTRPE